MTITTTIDLRDHLGPARDQCQRPTCLVFASTAAHEAGTTGLKYLSTEYLFYAGAQRSHKDPMRGLSADVTREAMLCDGQPLELDWPYLLITPDIADWTAPPITNSKYTATLEFRGRTLDEVRDSLSSGKPVILITDLTLAMHFAKQDGVVRVTPNDAAVGKHALLAVGCGTANDGDYFLVRNSWGISIGVTGATAGYMNRISPRAFFSPARFNRGMS